jgi:hypothetical protein
METRRIQLLNEASVWTSIELNMKIAENFTENRLAGRVLQRLITLSDTQVHLWNVVILAEMPEGPLSSEWNTLTN